MQHIGIDGCVDGFWVGDYGGGGPGRPPCWRTLEESCKGLGSVSLKNKQQQHTQPGPCEILVGPVETEFQGRLGFRKDGRPGGFIHSQDT